MTPIITNNQDPFLVNPWGLSRPVNPNLAQNQWWAADNATGCALLLELARLWCAQSPRPKRSALFLAVTAEEKGLLGSKYYTQHPLVPLGKTALNLNFDMILPLFSALL